MQTPSEEFDQARVTILKEIEEAFAGVSREGGASWGQVIQESAARARWEEEEFREAPWWLAMVADRATRVERPFHDRDQCWNDLVDDPAWETDPDFGGFAFLGPIAIRYYLPAAMVRSLRDTEEYAIAHSLAFTDHSKRFPNIDTDWRARFLERWSLLSDRQRLCVKHFLEHQIAAIRASLPEEVVSYRPSPAGLAQIEAILGVPWEEAGLQPWGEAYSSYWKGINEN